MKQIVLGFGLLIFSLLVLFKLGDYAFLRYRPGTGIWVGIFSVLFLVIGIILSRKMFRKEVVREERIFVEVPASTQIDQSALDKLALSKREYEILQLINEGLSNQQIGERLFLSEHTVKKHVSNLFFKMDVERRTEAIRKAREMRVI